MRLMWRVRGWIADFVDLGVEKMSTVTRRKGRGKLMRRPGQRRVMTRSRWTTEQSSSVDFMQCGL